MYGYDSAFIGGTLNLPSFQRQYGLDQVSDDAFADLSSNIVSTFQGGAFFGCAMGALFAEHFGRKLMLILAAFIFTIGAGLQMAGLLPCLYAGRVLTGWGVGASAMILPVYVSECAPAQIRGRLVGIFEVMLQIALVFGFWVNYGVNRNISATSSTQWHIPIGIQFIPAGLLIISMVFMVESPRWLMSKGREEAARRSLSWIRHVPEDHPYVAAELAAIKMSTEEELRSTGSERKWTQILKELNQSSIRRKLFLGCCLVFFQNFTGINAINYYSPTIFTSIGFTGTSNGLLATGIFGLVKMFATLLYAAILVDRVGRRRLLIVGGLGAMIAMFYLAGYSKVSGSFYQVPPMDSGARAAVAMVYIYALFYGFSWNGIPWLYTSEILPNRVRTIGMALVVCWQWLTQFVVVYSLPHMILAMKYGTFLFFGAWTVLATAFAWVLIPETKGVELEDMDLLFGKGVSWRASAAEKHYLASRDLRSVHAHAHDKVEQDVRVERAESNVEV